MTSSSSSTKAGSEPSLALDAGLAPILATLQTLEPLIYAANDGASTAHFEQLLAPGFWEVGASGRRYSRAFVLEVLAGRQQEPVDEAWTTGDAHLQRLAEHLYLLTYTLIQPTRRSRRASLWRFDEGHWQLVYHQGTTVQSPGP